MNQQQATEFVIRELGRHRSPQDIIRALCEQTGWPRKQVEYFVRKVEAEHPQEFTELVAPQAPQGRQRRAEVEGRQDATELVAPQAPQGRQRRVEAEGHQKEFTDFASLQAPRRRQRRAEVEGRQEAVESVAPQAPQRRQRRAEDEQHQEFTEFVIRELSGHRKHDDIIRALCEQSGWEWNQAQHFVQRVEVEHHDQITARQSPLLIALGVGSVLVGVLMMVGSVYLILNGEISEISLGFLITGPGLTVGGIAGLWRTRSMMLG